MNHRHYLCVFLLMLCFPLLLSAMPEFGSDGLAGLSEDQLGLLEQGEVVFTLSESGDQKSELIEAAFLLDSTPAEVWELLYRTENHDLYLKETESSMALHKTREQDLIAYRVRVLMFGASFWLIHHFDWDARYMRWDLAPGYDNGLREFRGFWRLYAYKDGRTLARYGNRVSPAGVPEFIVDLFRKGGIVKALESVRLYVESGGSYRK